MPKILSTLIGLLLPVTVLSQQVDSLLQQRGFTGAITVTNNGVSLIPTFTLGKPAVFFDIAVRKKRFSFEPQLTFALQDAKPWYFVFWLRYKLIDTPKFRLGAGFHPSVVFISSPLPVNNQPNDNLTAVRYFVGELVPTYELSDNASLGLYYLHARGFSGAARSTNFIGVNSNFLTKAILRAVDLRVIPQLYYVTIDGADGYYATATFTVTKPKFPFAFSSVVNQKIQSNIPSDDFIWNLSLTYSY